MPKRKNKEVYSEIELSVRCDSCSARAKYLVQLYSGYLFFCGHHFSKNQSELEALPSQLAIVNLETNSRLERK